MDANRKRRARRVGAPDPAVAAMTDAELLAAFVADPDAPPAPRPSGSPMVQMLRGLTDDELIAAYHEATAELAAQEAEIEHRRPRPDSLVSTDKSIEPPVVEPPVEPHPVALEPAPEPPPPAPGGHTGHAVEGCDCWLCAAHRAAARREAEDRALARLYEDEPMIDGSVRFDANATDELRERLTGGA